MASSNLHAGFKGLIKYTVILFLGILPIELLWGASNRKLFSWVWWNDFLHLAKNIPVAILIGMTTFSLPNAPFPALSDLHAGLVGFVFGLQGYYTLQRYGSSEALGLLVTLSLVRELGPVVTALLFAGRAGTSLTAEIGLMKAGEQLSVMEMMAVDPVQRVLAPRFWAGVISMPLLAAVFSAMGIIGGWVVGVLMIGVDSGSFWSQIQGGVDVWKDVGNGVIKSIVFGFTVTFVALLQGFEAQPTPEGVASATTRTVVVASLAVLGLDFILTAMMFTI